MLLIYVLSSNYPSCPLSPLYLQRLKEASTFDHPEKAQESQVRQQEALQSAVEAEHGFSRFVDFRSAAPTRHSACLVGIALTTILALWLGQ